MTMERTYEDITTSYYSVEVLETDPASGLQVMALKGELDVSNIEQCLCNLHISLDASWQPRRNPSARIIIDLSGCTYVDSLGLGIFISVMKVAEESGGKAVFACPPPFLKRLLDLTHLTQILAIADTREAAKALIETETE
jgi:anti-anti-sigma factor